MRSRLILAAAAVAALAAGEAAARLSGAVDVPIYRPDPVCGYAPRPDQAGAFLGRNRWAYNDRGMGVAKPWRPGGVLLVGDSIVNGGNPLDQAERLGPRLARLTGREVWPVSAGGWSILNELCWLRANLDVARAADEIVLVVNAADFQPPAVLPGTPDMPERRPLSAVAYLVDRTALARFRRRAAPPTTTRDWRDELAALRRDAGRPVRLVFYSRRGEAYRPAIDGLAVGADPRWRLATYRDATHVDGAGTLLLALLIAEYLGEPAQGAAMRSSGP